jgi:hypothetical protein
MKNIFCWQLEFKYEARGSRLGPSAGALRIVPNTGTVIIARGRSARAMAVTTSLRPGSVLLFRESTLVPNAQSHDLLGVSSFQVRRLFVPARRPLSHCNWGLAFSTSLRSRNL